MSCQAMYNYKLKERQQYRYSITGTVRVVFMIDNTHLLYSTLQKCNTPLNRNLIYLYL